MVKLFVLQLYCWHVWIFNAHDVYLWIKSLKVCCFTVKVSYQTGSVYLFSASAVWRPMLRVGGEGGGGRKREREYKGDVFHWPSSVIEDYTAHTHTHIWRSAMLRRHYLDHFNQLSDCSSLKHCRYAKQGYNRLQCFFAVVMSKPCTAATSRIWAQHAMKHSRVQLSSVSSEAKVTYIYQSLCRSIQARHVTLIL